MTKMTFIGATAALLLSTASASAAVFTYDLSDNLTAAFTTNGDGYNYGLRLDGYKGTATGSAADDADDQMIFSFSTDSGAPAATLKYDDVSGTVQIKGQMRRSLAGGGFGQVWDVAYQMLQVDNYGVGMFHDTIGMGAGSITNGTQTFDLGAKDDAAGRFFYFSDAAPRRDGTADMTGRGWVDTLFSMGNGLSNDFLFNADLVDTDPNGNLPPVPLPATGLLLVAALGGLGAMRRRKTA